MNRVRMINVTLTLLTGVIGWAAEEAAGQIEGTRNPVTHERLLTANPFLILAEWFNAEYEQKLNATSTVGLQGSVISIDDDDTDYVSLTAMWRYYPQGAALTGFYVGPRAGFYHVDDTDESANVFGVGFELGYNWLLGADRQFTIGMGVGANRLFGGDLDDDSAVVPTIRLVNIGWAF